MPLAATRPALSPARAAAGGAVLLVAGATLHDIGAVLDVPVLRSVASGLSVACGIGLAFLPFALRRLGYRGGWARAGTAAFVTGNVLASLVDVPTVLDPDDLTLGSRVGPVALLLVSAGMLCWYAATGRPGPLDRRTRRWLLAAGLWFPVQLPVNVALFIGPAGRPSFILLSGVLGALFLTIAVRAERAARGVAPAAPVPAVGHR